MSQPQLNGVYYGPPILPMEPPRRRSATSCCLCDCIYDCSCCLLGCIFKTICAVVVVVALLVLVFWLIFRPHVLEYYTAATTLTAFDYSGGQLNYNLTAGLRLRNPNKHVSVYYDSVEIDAFFDDQHFATKYVGPFFQDTKSTVELGPVNFAGKKKVAFDPFQVSEFEKQKWNGKFDIVLRMNMMMRLKVVWFKIKSNSKFRCYLTVPLSSSSEVITVFEEARCHLDYT